MSNFQGNGITKMLLDTPQSVAKLSLGVVFDNVVTVSIVYIGKRLISQIGN